MTRKSSKKGVNRSSGNVSDPKVLGVFVHFSDCLDLDVFLLHPMVKVLLVNLETGEFVTKSDSDKNVTCYSEANVKHILPLMTQVEWLEVDEGVGHS